MSQSYRIHDNGSEPFIVKISNNNDEVVILVNKNAYGSDYEDQDQDPEDLEDSDHEKPRYEYDSSGNIIFMRINNPNKVFIGKSPSNKMTRLFHTNRRSYDGNAILIKPSDDLTYIFVGPSIEKFTADSEILYFISPVGNNDVPYTYAISKNKIYLLSENAVVDVSDISQKLLQKFSTGSDEPYDYYYGHEESDEYNAKSSKLETEVLLERSGW